MGAHHHQHDQDDGRGRSQDHGHGHDHARSKNARRLTTALVLAAVYLVAEVVGGLYTGSLALLADAGHMASDVGSLALALGALWLAQRPATPEKSFGYQRAEILAALANATALCVVTVLIFVEAYARLKAPQPVLAGPMLVIAVGGLVVNLVAAGILHGGKDESLNMRGAFLHVLADALGSLGAVASGALILSFGWYWADPAASFVIGTLVLFSAWGLLRQAVGVLMQMAPAHLDMREVTEAMRLTRGVCDVHDVHAWTVTSGREVLSAHVVIDDAARHDAILRDLQDLLRERFDLDHVTLQLEQSEDVGCDCSFGQPVTNS